MAGRHYVEGPIRGQLSSGPGEMGAWTRAGAVEGDSVKTWGLLVTEVREKTTASM